MASFNVFDVACSMQFCPKLKFDLKPIIIIPKQNISMPILFTN